MKKINSNGFTLLELLVVISIIGLLSSVIFASVSSARQKAEDAQTIALGHELKNAANTEYYATSKVPGEISVDPTSITDAGPLVDKVTDLVTGGYIKTLPTDSTHYIYYWYYSDIAKNSNIVNYKCENDNVTKYIIAVWSDRTLNLPKRKNMPSDTYSIITRSGIPFYVYCLSYL